MTIYVDQGVYEFKKLTLLGYSSDEEEIKTLVQKGFKVWNDSKELSFLIIYFSICI